MGFGGQRRAGHVRHPNIGANCLRREVMTKVDFAHGTRRRQRS